MGVSTILFVLGFILPCVLTQDAASEKRHSPSPPPPPPNYCANPGYSGKPANAVSCVNSPAGARTITCAAGYYANAPSSPSIILPGFTAFSGCFDIRECTVYAYSGRATNAASCVENSINTRTITCLPGFFAVAPINPSVTLTGAAAFGGCTAINECTAYGYSGKDANTLSCVDGANQRTITCRPGFYAVAPNIPSITLTGNTAFAGCTDINECSIYGFNGKPEHTTGCTQPAPNQRLITCVTGYAIVGRRDNAVSVTLDGNAVFGGCELVNLCTEVGYSGRPEGTLSCTHSVNSRTITCQPGFFAVGPDIPTITLSDRQPFLGCTDINECVLYGNNGQGANVLSCTNLVNARTITCAVGYYAVAPATQSVTLTGKAVFGGCKNINECELYGYSGKPGNTSKCAESAPGERTITCNLGYAALLPTTPSIVLKGDAPFLGCKDISECNVYGSSAKPLGVEMCVEKSPNQRTITCNPGWKVADPDVPSVTLIGNQEFKGCSDIEECKVYGTSGKPANVASCTDSTVNRRQITCNDGYSPLGDSSEVANIFLIGNAIFPGCTETDECKLLGFSGKPENTAGCIDHLDARTIKCSPGHWIIGVAPRVNQIRLEGEDLFAGCRSICGDGFLTSGEDCDDGNMENSDGCSNCKIDPGYVCNVPGLLCCLGLETAVSNFVDLECKNSWWVSRNSDGIIRFNDLLLINSPLRICGLLQIGGTEQDNNFWVNNTHLHVAGGVLVTSGGILSLNNTATVTIDTSCEHAPAPVDQPGLRVDTNGKLYIEHNVWSTSSSSAFPTESRPFVLVSSCSAFQGGFVVNSTLTEADEDFPVIVSDRSCTELHDTHYVDAILPRCDSASLEHNENGIVYLSMKEKNLCPGQIAAVVVGSVSLLGLLGLLGILLLRAGAGGASWMSSGEDYVAL